MFPGETVPDHSDTATRRMLYAKAQSLLGEGTDPEVVMRVAEWLDTGGPVLDPVRLQAAARVRAAQDTSYAGRPLVYDAISPRERAEYDGMAAQIVTAYLRGAS